MKIQLSGAKAVVPLRLLPLAVRNQSGSLDSQSPYSTYQRSQDKLLRNMEGQFLPSESPGSAPLLKCMHNHSSPWVGGEGSSAGSREPRLRVASKLYGKRGAQDDHVAAKHRPAGMRGMRGAASRASPAVTPEFRARVCESAEATLGFARASQPPSTTGSRDPMEGSACEARRPFPEPGARFALPI